MTYRVVLTPLAERHYEALDGKAEKHLKRGESESPFVLTFNAVGTVLKTILTEEPERGLRLAGVVSYLHCISAGDAVILYRVREARSEVIVISIREQVPGLRKAISDELENGSLNRLLVVLGIMPRLTQVELRDDLVM